MENFEHFYFLLNIITCDLSRTTVLGATFSTYMIKFNCNLLKAFFFGIDNVDFEDFFVKEGGSLF